MSILYRLILPPLTLCLPWVMSAQAIAGDTASPAMLSLPFAVGEHLSYTGRAEHLGARGKGAMWIEGPVEVRGVNTWLIRFDFKAGVGPIKSSDRTSSWIDAATMTSLRYNKQERRVLSGFDEAVELFPAERSWKDSDGKSGTMTTDNPLDELSFIYFVRTLPLAVDSSYEFSRHFDPARNPTRVRVVGRKAIDTKAGTFQTLEVEMTVRDPRNYKGDGTIRLFLSDDARRIPVRIESRMPVVGLATLTLDAIRATAGVAPIGAQK